MRHSTRWHRVALAALVGIAFLLAPALGHAQAHFDGSIGPGSFYEIDVPDQWNGSLVLYAHSRLNADQPLVPPSQLPEFVEVRTALLAGHFAVAASSYSSNGWALDDAVRRTHQLAGLFASKVGAARRTYLAGASMGALVALELAETHPGQYDGALALCGPLGGALPEIQYVGNARVLFDYYFPGVLPGEPFFVPPGTSFLTPLDPGGPSPLFLHVVNALASDTAATIIWANTAQLPFKDMTELANSALFIVGFSLGATNDFIARVNGKMPFDNRDVQYIVSGTGNPILDASLSSVLNGSIDRFGADRSAVNYYERNYTPSGQIGIPVVTLHTTRDPAIPFSHEEMFGAAVAAAGRASLLKQLPIDRWGHCAFTTPEVQAAFGSLVQWVETGVKP